MKHFESFKEAVLKSSADGEVGAAYILEELDRQLSNVYKQLSMFDIQL